MKNKLKIILGGALLVVTSIAVAGIIFVPVGGRYANPELAPVEIQPTGDGSLSVRTTDLTGELSLDASDVPPEFEVPVPGCARLPFDQSLQLVINLSLGVVEGRSSGSISTLDGLLEYRTEVSGYATCVAFSGRSCGQIIVDLELRGTLSDPTDPSLVGLLRMETLGSLLRDQGSASWVSLTSSARLGGDAGLISSLLDTMVEGEFCGV